MDRIILEAPEGMLYTNGIVYGSKIHLAEGMRTDGFRLITKGEYDLIEKENEEKTTE